MDLLAASGNRLHERTDDHSKPSRGDQSLLYIDIAAIADIPLVVADSVEQHCWILPPCETMQCLFHLQSELRQSEHWPASKIRDGPTLSSSYLRHYAVQVVI